MTQPAPTSLAELQRQFAAHIRDPANQAPPGDVSPRRMQVYTELFFRNIEQLLVNGFPVIRRLLMEDEWQSLVRDFMVRHRCRTPLFTQLGREFVAFLESHEAALAARPFLAELARHEQLEVEVAFATDNEPAKGREQDADLLDQALQLVPSARITQFRFPVHRISPEFQPLTPPEMPTWLLLYRDAQEHVRFMELDGFGYTLLVLLEQHRGATARPVLESLAAALGHVDVEKVLGSGREFLHYLDARGALSARA